MGFVKHINDMFSRWTPTFFIRSKSPRDRLNRLGSQSLRFVFHHVPANTTFGEVRSLDVFSGFPLFPAPIIRTRDRLFFAGSQTSANRLPHSPDQAASG